MDVSFLLQLWNGKLKFHFKIWQKNHTMALGISLKSYQLKATVIIHLFKTLKAYYSPKKDLRQPTVIFKYTWIKYLKVTYNNFGLPESLYLLKASSNLCDFSLNC